MNASGSPVQGAASENAWASVGLSALRVLVVDDDKLCLKVISKMLQQCSYEVVTCADSSEAIAQLRDVSAHFDIVLSDVVMPDIDGFKLLEIIGLEMDIPVIMMSYDGDTNTVLKGVTHGAVDFLIKPVRLEELRNMWQHVVRKRRLQHADQDPNADAAMKQQSSSHSSGDGGRRAALEAAAHAGDAGLGTPLAAAGGSFPAGAGCSDGAQRGSGSGSIAGGGTGMVADARAAAAANPNEPPRKRSHDETEKPVQRQHSGKRPRVHWTSEMHSQFVAAVNKLGIDKAVPKKILEMMTLEGLTRENVASHLQKYRLYLKKAQRMDGTRAAASEGHGGSQSGGKGPSSPFGPSARQSDESPRHQAVTQEGAPQQASQQQPYAFVGPRGGLVMPGMAGMPPGSLPSANMGSMPSGYTYMPGQWAMAAPMGAMSAHGGTYMQPQYGMMPRPMASSMPRQEGTAPALPFSGMVAPVPAQMPQQPAYAQQPSAQTQLESHTQHRAPSQHSADLPLPERAGSGMLPALSSDTPGGQSMSKVGQGSADILDTGAGEFDPGMGSTPEDMEELFNSMLAKDGQRDMD